MTEPKLPAVYILASKRNGTLYTGVTGYLWGRVAAHKSGEIKRFTQKYHVKMLVWYEHHHFMLGAIKREKQLKEWKRAWKLQLIEALNPDWQDLHEAIDSVATLVNIEPNERLGPGFRRDDGVVG